MRNIISQMWKNEDFLKGNYTDKDYADSFKSLINVLGLGLKGKESLNKINNPYLTKYNQIDQNLLKYLDYSILFIIISLDDQDSIILLQDKIEKLKNSHDLIIGIILNQNEYINLSGIFDTYIISELDEVNFIIEGILSSFVLYGLICKDLSDIINFFSNKGKLNLYITDGKIEEILTSLELLNFKGSTNHFITIFNGEEGSLYDVDEILKNIIDENIENYSEFSCPWLYILDKNVYFIVLIYN